MKKPPSASKGTSSLEEKIFVISDEVIEILKQLSVESKQQLSSKLIAERMFVRDNVKQLLSVDEESYTASRDREDAEAGDIELCLSEMANNVIEKFSEIIPSTASTEISELKCNVENSTLLKAPLDWVNSTLAILKKYFKSVEMKNNELEQFLKYTMEYLSMIESYLTSELSAKQNRFSDDNGFENTLTFNMKEIQKDIGSANNLDKLKKAVLKKIDNINHSIEKKRVNDMRRLKETEETLIEMTSRINDIKKEADDMHKKSKEMESETVRDQLTGLYNRKAYDQKMKETLASRKRYDMPATLLLCDIDYFKKINDEFGHSVGDLALKKLANLLLEKVRINDFVSRFGGEEFTIILFNTSLDKAMIAGEGLRDFINGYAFSYKSKEIPLTLSIGVSSFQKEDDMNSVFERADSALYLAKSSGRNTVKSEKDVALSGTGV